MHLVALPILCVAALLTPPAANTRTGQGKWRVTTGTSRMDDSKTVVSSLAAENTIRAWPDRIARPKLVFRCNEGVASAFVDVGVQSHVESASDVTTVQIRMDQDAVQTIQLGQSTDGEGLFFAYPVNAALEILEHQRMVLRFTPFRSTPQEAIFDVRGFEAALRPVQDACGWDPRQDLADAQSDLATRLRSPLASVRAQAAKDAGRFGVRARPLIPALIRALEDADLSVRVAAADALGSLGPIAAEAIPALEAAAVDAGRRIRIPAEDALEQIRSTPN